MAEECGEASKELKAKAKSIQLNRSKSVSPVGAKDAKSDDLELSKSLNDDRNLMHQLNKKINSCLDSRKSPVSE